MKTAFQELLAKAIEDEAFSRQLQENPQEALKSHNLTEAEIAALKGLRPETLQALRLRDTAAIASAPWWKPASFRETGAAVLSAILVILLTYATVATFGQVEAVPKVYAVGENVQFVDTFNRAKDLFSILFPVFGAVVTFWLGVTVEGRRADRSEAEADKAKVEKDTAQTEADKAKVEKATADENARAARNIAAETLLEAEAALLEQSPAPGSGFERSGGAASEVELRQTVLLGALSAIRAGRQKLTP